MEAPELERQPAGGASARESVSAAAAYLPHAAPGDTPHQADRRQGAALRGSGSLPANAVLRPHGHLEQRAGRTARLQRRQGLAALRLHTKGINRSSVLF